MFIYTFYILFSSYMGVFLTLIHSFHRQHKHQHHKQLHLKLYLFPLYVLEFRNLWQNKLVYTWRQPQEHVRGNINSFWKMRLLKIAD